MPTTSPPSLIPVASWLVAVLNNADITPVLLHSDDRMTVPLEI